MTAIDADSRPSVASALGTALMDLWSSWSAHFPVTEKVAGSSPVRFAFYLLSVMEVYGVCSSVGRAFDCDSKGRGFKPRHSPG